jgi:CRISP-associated protein Cas1
MFTRKDIEFKTIFVINCIDERNLRVSNGELLLEEKLADSKKTLTKMPFQKILALFIVGDITITTPLIEKCHKYNVALVVMKPNLRPVFYWSNSAEANFLLHQRQYQTDKNDISIAKVIVCNKIQNQKDLLIKTRKKDASTIEAIKHCDLSLDLLDDIDDYHKLLGLEGCVAKNFFAAYYQLYNWKSRMPRTKCDILNTTLDIGYTILFNFMECFVRMFGFDLYIGIYHRLWFKRKSLICDLIEPFRCLIDHAVLLAYNRQQFSAKDFIQIKGEYHLRYDKTQTYYQVFYEALIARKQDFFLYVQSYYRCFMQKKSVSRYPKFTM